MLGEVARAAVAQRDSQRITYLIRDPRRPDKRGNEGIPIHVGQTNDFPKRVLNRFNKCEKEALGKGNDCAEQQVADLLHLGLVPTYQVLEYQPTRLRSLVSKTNWAPKCWNAGYHLANLRELQNEGGTPISRADIPSKWLWEFSLEDAIADEVQPILICDACGDELAIHLAVVAERQSRPRTVGELRRALRAEPCFACKVAGKRRLRLSVYTRGAPLR